MSFRPSTLAERRRFYTKYFNINKLSDWLVQKPQFYALDLGYDSGISIKPTKALIILGPNISLAELKQKLLDYLPEDVYYDTNQYKDPAMCIMGKSFVSDSSNVISKELVFDIDPENFKCPKCGKKKYPQFCETCLRLSLMKAGELAHYIETRYHYEDISLIYSGRGAHVHVNDPAARTLTQEQRQKIVNDCKDFAIDPWVTTNKRLIRLPYTLNGLVSRVAVPFHPDEADVFNTNEAKPEFIH